MKKKTKTSLVLSHLNRYGSITTWKAIGSYKAHRVSAIIHTLRHKRKLDIKTTSIKFIDEFGNEQPCAKYQLVK